MNIYYNSFKNLYNAYNTIITDIQIALKSTFTLLITMVALYSNLLLDLFNIYILQLFSFNIPKEIFDFSRDFISFLILIGTLVVIFKNIKNAKLSNTKSTLEIKEKELSIEEKNLELVAKRLDLELADMAFTKAMYEEEIEILKAQAQVLKMSPEELFNLMTEIKKKYNWTERKN